MTRNQLKKIVLIVGFSLFTFAGVSTAEEKDPPRLTMFIGVDVSGSFMKSRYFDDSLNFLAHYIYGHLKGIAGLDVPKILFVGSLGGMKGGEPQTMYPIQNFEHKSVEGIHSELKRLFPKTHNDRYTDFNAFFKQAQTICKSKGLILRPISIVLISDGEPDYPGQKGHDVSKIELQPFELISRNVTIRLLYTDAKIGDQWSTKIKRSRVKVLTQDAKVMVSWKDAAILQPGKSFQDQSRFFDWLKDNVDSDAHSQTVD